jgi:hypothetical protein
MQAIRIIEARDRIARAAYAAMRRVEEDAVVWRSLERKHDRGDAHDRTGRGKRGGRRSEPGMLAVLSAQRADARQLAQDAQARGWSDEGDRHRALVERLDAIIAKANAA